MKKIWLVTHGETVLRNPSPHGAWQPDPRMSDNGIRAVARLASILREKLQGATPSEVHCGTGHRQWQVAETLGHFDPAKVLFSSLWGDASTLAVREGERMVLLGHGLLIPYTQYLSALHVGGKTIREVIMSLPHNSLVCSGRPVLVRLGMKPEECHSGALYLLRPLKVESGKIIIDIELVEKGTVLAS